MHPKYIILAIITAVIVTSGSLVAYHSANPTYTVKNKSWKYHVDILKEEMVTEYGWSYPEGAKILKEESKYYETITPVIGQKPVHRTTIIPQFYSCGKSFCTRYIPVSRTDYVDVYGEPYDVYKSWYTYKYMKKTPRSVVNTGNYDSFAWPSFVLDKNEHEVSRVEYYTVDYEDWFHRISNRNVDREEWLAIQIGEPGDPSILSAR